MMFPKPSKSAKKDRLQSDKRARFLAQLADDLQSNEVYGCEICYLEHEMGTRKAPKKGCEIIDPAHRHERENYYNRPEMLWTKNQVIFAGRAHHVQIDADKALRASIFQRLRGNDEL